MPIAGNTNMVNTGITINQIGIQTKNRKQALPKFDKRESPFFKASTPSNSPPSYPPSFGFSLGLASLLESVVMV